MALKVVDSKFTHRNGTVIIEAASQEEVMTPEARKLALEEAGRNGLSKAGLSGNETVYPVDAEGKTSEDLVFGRNGTQVAAYRADFSVTAGL